MMTNIEERNADTIEERITDAVDIHRTNFGEEPTHVMMGIVNYTILRTRVVEALEQEDKTIEDKAPLLSYNGLEVIVDRNLNDSIHVGVRPY